MLLWYLETFVFFSKLFTISLFGGRPIRARTARGLGITGTPVPPKWLTGVGGAHSLGTLDKGMSHVLGGMEQGGVRFHHDMQFKT